MKEMVKCARKGCEVKFVKNTVWHLFCSSDCKYIDWADRKRKKIDGAKK